MRSSTEYCKYFRQKLTLYVYFAVVFMLFYLLLHSVRACKMHAFRMLNFVLSDCMMMHCLMTQWCDAVLHCIMLQWIIMCYTILKFMMLYTLHMMLHYKMRWSNDHLATSKFWQVPAYTGLIDSIPISKRCNYVRIDSACRVLLQSRFNKHTFPQHEIWLDQIQWKCNGASPLQAVCDNSDNRIKFRLRFIIIIYHDFLPTPRRGSHVKSGKTHTQSSRYTP